MRPEVQVLPGLLPALTSANAGHRIRSPVGVARGGSRTLTWLPCLVIGQTVYPLIGNVVVVWMGLRKGPGAVPCSARRLSPGLALDRCQAGRTRRPGPS